MVRWGYGPGGSLSRALVLVSLLDVGPLDGGATATRTGAPESIDGVVDDGTNATMKGRA